jgi:stage II sporulation protein R
MKKFVTGILSILTAMLIVAALPTEADAGIYDDTLRLHILAASDSEEDQAEKLLVRDAVLAYLEDSLAQSGSYDSALSSVGDHLEGIRKRAEEALGNKYAVRVELGREKYPVRQYENYSLPAGKYTSLRVLIGEGEGKNWWCVLFPRLCTSRATEEEMYEEFIAAGFSPEQYRLIKNESSPKYKIRFRILEILSEWTGLDY